MYDYDLAMLNGYRREARHTQKLDLSAFDDELDEGKNPLLDKFAKALTVEIDRNDVNRYAWIDEIEDERVAAALKRLNESDTEFITLLIVDGYTQDELASKYGVHKSNISRRYTRIKNFIKSFL